MEDVVLHCQSGPADQLGSLLERTQKLLEPFPCRPPPPFTPWFPSNAADRRLPIRPARPAPVIAASEASLVSHRRPLPENTPQRQEVSHRRAETPGSPPEPPQTGGDVLCLSETPAHLLPASPCHGLSPDKPRTDRGGFTGADSPIKRSWSVFARGGVLQQSAQSLSTQFGHMVSVHKLHLRQRAKWVIGEHNCGAGRDLEQVWRSLSRSVRSSRLPTCNANIQRERAEIWVFCDVLYSEQVGRLLKEELQLSGRISLSVRRLGDVFSA